MNNTRLFFVVQCPEKNNEIFETLEEATEYAIDYPHTEIFIAMVKNAYKEKEYLKENQDLRWNYNDLSDTFKFIKKI